MLVPKTCRLPTEAINTIDVPTLVDEVKSAQLTDPDFPGILQRLNRIQREGARERGEKTFAEVYFVECGHLFKRNGQKKLLWVPETVRPRILHIFHDSPEAGHPGQEETYRSLKKFYAWPTAQRDVKAHVRNCLVCATTKRGSIQAAAPLRCHNPQQSWQTIALDYMGPYEATPDGNRYLLVVTDLFSRWVEAFPVKSATARVTTTILEKEVFSRWGYPRAVITDNGSQFRSGVFRRACHRWQEIKKILRITRQTFPELPWDHRLTKGLFNLRRRSNAATGQTPSHLLLGFDLRGPGEWEWDDGPVQESTSERHEQARNQQKRYRERYIRPGPPLTKFQLGDLVLVRHHTRRGFEPKWVGPVRVIADARGNCYWVERGTYATREHLDSLRLAPGQVTLDTETPQEPDETGDEEEAQEPITTPTPINRPSTSQALPPADAPTLSSSIGADPDGQQVGVSGVSDLQGDIESEDAQEQERALYVPEPGTIRDIAPITGTHSGPSSTTRSPGGDVHVPDDTRSRSRRPKSEAEKKTSWVSRCPQTVQPATHRIQLQLGAKSVAQRERRTNHNIGITATPAPAGVQAASIAELVSRRTTVETPGSLNPQPARRGRIREDATVPQPSVIPTRTSPGRLSPRAPTASPDSTSARRSQRDRWVPSLCASRGSCRFSRAVRAQRQPLDKSTEPTIGGPDHEEPCRCASRIVAQRHRGGCPPGQLQLPGPREARRDVGQPAARDKPHKIEDDMPRRPKNIRGANGPDEKHRVCVVCAEVGPPEGGRVSPGTVCVSVLLVKLSPNFSKKIGGAGREKSKPGSGKSELGYETAIFFDGRRLRETGRIGSCGSRFDETETSVNKTTPVPITPRGPVGYDKPKAYIACQGPKFYTVKDFWRLIWQEKVETIVMATNLLENKKRMCAEYWPQKLNALYECGNMTIKLIKEENFEYHDIRQSAYEQFVETYPEEQIEYPNFAQHCERIVERFISTGNVGKGKSTGRPTVATPDVQNVEEIVEEHPHISIRRLSQQIEPNGLSRDDGKRPDGMTLVPWIKGQPLVWDVTVVDTLADSYVLKSSEVSGFAAEMACKRKHSKYSSIISSNYVFKGLAFETLGPWCKEAIDFINVIGNRLIAESGYSKSNKFLFERISLAIQRGNAASIRGTFPDSAILSEIFVL
ncbi:hypothetical protein GEV33_007683 [Tenebrio molitor]|uniref:RNA-directed DNA polymerase n=1 Tax=Tenebrio molitor TaxID=7067 RepID=A0A8J6LCU4_TENMO|nr:hypothetical protein GEV33_007683 [Tenebrio molitor]